MIDIDKCNYRYQMARKLINGTEITVGMERAYIPEHLGHHLPSFYMRDLTQAFKDALEIICGAYGVKNISHEKIKETIDVDEISVVAVGAKLIKAEDVPLCAIHYRYIRRDWAEICAKRGDPVYADLYKNHFGIRLDLSLQDLSGGDGEGAAERSKEDA